jgi:hypothetical protein
MLGMMNALVVRIFGKPEAVLTVDAFPSHPAHEHIEWPSENVSLRRTPPSPNRPKVTALPRKKNSPPPSPPQTPPVVHPIMTWHPATLISGAASSRVVNSVVVHKPRSLSMPPDMLSQLRTRSLIKHDDEFKPPCSKRTAGVRLRPLPPAAISLLPVKTNTDWIKRLIVHYKKRADALLRQEKDKKAAVANSTFEASIKSNSVLRNSMNNSDSPHSPLPRLTFSGAEVLVKSHSPAKKRNKVISAAVDSCDHHQQPPTSVHDRLFRCSPIRDLGGRAVAHNDKFNSFVLERVIGDLPEDQHTAASSLVQLILTNVIPPASQSKIAEVLEHH